MLQALQCQWPEFGLMSNLVKGDWKMWSSQVLKKEKGLATGQPSSLCHMGHKLDSRPLFGQYRKYFQTYQPSFLATPASRRSWFMFAKG